MKSQPPSESLTVVAGSGQARSAIALLSTAFSRLFVMGRRPVLLRDLDSWQPTVISPFLASHAKGLLPLFVLAGNAVWADLGETPFPVRMQDCRRALAGIELVSIAAPDGNLTPLMLAMMEAISQVADQTGILVNDLGPLIERAPGAQWVGATLAMVPQPKPALAS
jgi:hypothetical protein